MSGAIRLYGETSGFVELKAPAVADDNTIDIGLIPTIDTAPSDGQVLTWNASLSKWEAKDAKMKEKRIARFTGNGTWTVPAGVTYAIAHMMGGGGGGAGSAGVTGATAGGNSSVAFATGTVVAEGGPAATRLSNVGGNSRITVPANSGRGGGTNLGGSGDGGGAATGANGTSIVAGSAVTPAASISVVVGAGGNGSTSGDVGSPGAAGYVYIEYYEEV